MSETKREALEEWIVGAGLGAAPSRPERGVGGRCCERDYDGDGNCDKHPQKGDQAVKHVGRGLMEFSKFKDAYRSEIRVQTSSSAEGPHVWVFCTPATKQAVGDPAHVCMAPHLTVAQAKRLRDGLDKFIKWAEGQT